MTQREPDLIAGSATGSIYDLGYRGYEGPRLGRGHAFRVLYTHSLRGAFGIGRGGRAKIWPFTMAAFILLPALVVVAFTALAGQFVGQFDEAIPIRPATFINSSRFFLVLLVVGQAPELLGRDLRSRTLTLYFSRALGRLDYALAKFLALATAVALVILVPQALMLVGMVFTSTDLTVGLGKALPLVWPVAVSAAAAAALLSGISLAIAGFTPRRAYASGSIAALLLVFSSAIALVVSRGGNQGVIGWFALLDPGTLMDGFSAFVFGGAPDFVVRRSGLPLPAFAGAMAVWIAATVGILVVRYRRIQA